MERYADLFKKHVINFKLELCCFMATVRTGLLTFACLNIAIGYITLIFSAEGSFEPLLLKTLNGIKSEPPSYGAPCLIVYAVELGSNVLLLCGIIRNDLVLLRSYLYFALGVLTAALMVYSVMFRFQSAIVECLIIASIGYQVYIILLVRSLMVEIKLSSVRNRYKVNYRQSSVRYSRPTSRDKYSVVIEPYSYRPRRSLVPVVTDINNKPNKTLEVAKKEPVIIHPPTKQGDVKEVINEGTAKEEQEDVTKELKSKDTTKRRRSIFGKKEKVKKHETPSTKSES